MSVAVELKHIDKDFPVGDDQTRVLFDITADIRLGELTMIVGPSGCGKTTLISILSGILSSSGGEVSVLDSDITHMKDAKRVLFRRKHIGFIFQQYNLLPSLTAAENAALPLIADGISLGSAVEKARIILSSIGMEGQTEKLPRQLSGGQQQRVAITRALIHEPQLIVCDEPTAALDAKTGQAVMKILREIATNSNRAVLVVTHDSRIYGYADRILEMSDGRIVGDHKPKDFLHKEQI